MPVYRSSFALLKMSPAAGECISMYIATQDLNNNNFQLLWVVAHRDWES